MKRSLCLDISTRKSPDIPKTRLHWRRRFRMQLHSAAAKRCRASKLRRIGFPGVTVRFEIKAATYGRRNDLVLTPYRVV